MSPARAGAREAIHSLKKPSLRYGLFAVILFGIPQLIAQQQHEPKSIPQPDQNQPFDQAIRDKSMRTCAKECHQEVFQHKTMHGPALTKCEACHVQGNPSEHKFYLIRPAEQLCKGCHQLPHQGIEHTPVREGKCQECHDPHGSDQPRMLKADPKRELCLKCHDQSMTKKAFVHGPVAVGACIVCHVPHASKEPKLLAMNATQLCQSCHQEVADKADSPGSHKHEALNQGCTHCHDPHASDHKFQLKSAAPELCMTCHRDQFDKMIGDAKVVHGVITQEGGCTGCHEPHGSKLAKLQRTSQPELCLSCHNKELLTKEGEKLTNMAALLKDNPDHHGPIREGECTACHNPHAGQHFRLLAEEYPPDFYAPFNLDTFKLCFKCHMPDLVLKPSGQGLTQFRDGDRNLHYLHVNQQKGRTCRACHEVHASKHPSHIRDAVPFGANGWLLEINFKQLPEGGSCAPACHATKEYTRTKPLAPLSASSNPLQPTQPEKTP